MGTDHQTPQNTPDASWKPKALAIGGALGALAGLAAAYMYIRNIEEMGEAPRLSTKDAMSVGVSLVSLVRQIAGMKG